MPAKTTTQHQLTFANTALSVSEKLFDALITAVSNKDISQARAITVNFRDSDYSVDAGGFHPVEISFTKTEDNHCSLLYITDFSFSRGHYPELDRDLDFDISNNVFFARYSGWQPLESREALEMYKLWEGNFLAFLEVGRFDEIKVECF